MQQKITITLSTLAVLLGGAGIPQAVLAEASAEALLETLGGASTEVSTDGELLTREGASTEEASNLIYDENRLFIATRIDPLHENIDGDFNHFQIPEVRLHRGIYLTYDETKVSQKYVEEHLAEYIVNPEVDWVKETMIFENWAGFGAQIISSSRVEEWEGDKVVIKDYRPGVVYYIMETTWQDNPTEKKWYWGKIDYRRCVAELAETGIAMGGICSGWMPDEGGYRLDRVGLAPDPGEAYVSWAEELQKTLEGELTILTEKVKAWEGDRGERRELLADLKRLRLRADDAGTTAVLQGKVDELIACLGEDEEEGGSSGTEGSTGSGEGGSDETGGGNEGGTEGDDSDETGDGNEDNKGGNGAGSTAGSGIGGTKPATGVGQIATTITGVASGLAGQNGGGSAENDSSSISQNGGSAGQNAGVVEQNEGLVGQNDGVAGQNSQKQSENGQGMDLENSAEKTLSDEKMTDRDVENVELPALSEGKTAILSQKWLLVPAILSQKWLLVPAICSILLALIALGVWIWRKYSHRG